jgi:hypothetical protein
VSRFDDVEQFWSAILSEQTEEVLAAWRTLDAEERRDIEKHLLRMIDPAEEYAEGQQGSARFALATIRGQKN